MDTKQLLTMITLSQTLNYQKAAEQLQYAPSTLFKHIQMLEQVYWMRNPTTYRLSVGGTFFPVKT